MGDLQPGGDHIGDWPDGAGDQTQAVVTAIFVAFVEEQLHTQADAEKRLAGSGQFFDHGIQAGPAKLPGGILKGADTGEQYFVRGPQHGGVGGDGGFRPVNDFVEF